MSSLPSLSLDHSLSEISASGKKKIADVFLNQAYKEFIENPGVESYIDANSPSVPISFLYDLSNENSTRGTTVGIGMLRTASSSDLPSFNFDDFSLPNMPTERSLSAPCIAQITDEDGDTVDEVLQELACAERAGTLLKPEVGTPTSPSAGTLTLRDFDKQILAHVAANTPGPAPASIFNNQYKYDYVLDAPISIVQRKGDDTLTYLNKGQYYILNFCSNPHSLDRLDFNVKVKSIVHVVFRNQERRKERDFWTYWYAQQPNSNIRVFDVDERACASVEEISQIGCNAVSFTWNSNIGAKVVIRINCLSTEFSSQKGVKGTPLYVQVDTFEDTESLNPEPADRCYSQIKVFRDKGAERKNKDESRTADRKLRKLLKNGQVSRGETDEPGAAVFHTPCRQTVFTKTSVFGPKPVIFTAPVRNLTFGLNGENDDLTSLLSDQKLYSPYHVTNARDHVTNARDHVPTFHDLVSNAHDLVNSSIDHVANTLDHLANPLDNLTMSRNQVNIARDQLSMTCDQVSLSHDQGTSPTSSCFADVASVGSNGSATSDQSERQVSFSSNSSGSPAKQLRLSSTSSNSPAKQNDSIFTVISDQIRERETKRSISQALSAASEGSQHFNPGTSTSENSENNDRPKKAARIERPRATVYVKRADERIYSALCLKSLTLEALQDEVSTKYSIPRNMPAKLYKRTRKGLLIHMDTRMVEQFQDEDDFIIEVSFQNNEGVVEVTFIY